MNNLTIPTVRLAAEWDAEDPEVERIWRLMKVVIDHLNIDEASVDAADFAADRLWDELNTARNHYQKIRRDTFSCMTTTQQTDEYKELYSALWAAYKDRLQVLMHEIGYDIGFVFQNDKAFELGATAFITKHPTQKWLVDYARKLRADWQTDFGTARNKKEHSGDLRDIATNYDTPEKAKQLFEVISYVIEGVFAMLASEMLEHGWLIALIDDDETIFGRGERFALRHRLEPTF